MKTILIITAALIIASQCFSQTKKQGYSLTTETPETIKKEGKTFWKVTTTLTNYSKDTLYYFSTTCSEQAYYSIDTNVLYVDFQKCNSDAQTVIKINPGGHRTVNLEIASSVPLKTSITFRILFFLFRAKDINERRPMDNFGKPTVIIMSDALKT